MKKRLIPIIAALVLAGALAAGLLLRPPMQKFSATFFGTFDTVVSVTGYARSESDFQREFDAVKALFTHYHQLFDNYNAYEGVVNLYVLNRDAGQGPVRVDEEMMSFLRTVMDMQAFAGTDEVNIAMGSVLRLWHEAREISEGAPDRAVLPDREALTAAYAHTDLSQLILDEENRTVYFADPEMKLDLGAVAKGYAAEKAAQYLEKSSMPSFIISAGGNVRTGVKPADGRDSWKVGVQHPDDPQQLLDALAVNELSVVTSGDYQRYYLLDGKRYHHIISPATLMPADAFRAVTVITRDSGWADFLSTRLFILPYEEGRAFVDSLRANDSWDSAEVMWVLADGTVQMTDGYRALSLNLGAQ